MPLHLLVALVVFGIAGIMILTVVMGFNKPRRFETDEEARYAFNREFPTAQVTGVLLCNDRSAALVETDQGPGVVWAIGADSTARFLSGARIDRVDIGLDVHFPDYAAPVARLSLDAAEADTWANATKDTTQ